MDEKTFEKILEKAFSQGLLKKNIFTSIVNHVKYFLFETFNYVNYKKFAIHENRITLYLPDFFSHYHFREENIISYEFNYKNKMGVAVALDKAGMSLEDYVERRNEAVERYLWAFLEDSVINLNSGYKFTQLLFSHRKIEYIKGIFVYQCNVDEFLTITITSPLKHFSGKTGFIHKLFNTIEIFFLKPESVEL